MGALVLDSTVLIDALRGRASGRRIQVLLDQGETLMTTAVNVEEIVRGANARDAPATESLFAALAVLPITDAVARRSGVWRREFAGLGLILHQADCLIAAATMDAGARLATANVKDFPMLADRVEHWPTDLQRG